jgi:flagellar L-ring protein precursor FlgH
VKEVSLRRLAALASVGAIAVLLGGCNALDRLASVGETPNLSPIENPVREANYQPVTMPMPRPEPAMYRPNSLWRTGAKAFFKDQRAANVGDVLTVNIEIEDQAQLANTTERSRTTEETDSAGSLLGLEAGLNQVFPEEVDPLSLVNIDGSTTNRGEGTVDRSETIALKIAAIVTQVLPNGNLVIQGRQEIRVNYEVRELFINGVVRPQDISSGNTIDYDKVAEARVAYGGRGIISDVQQLRYGTQILDIIYPF